MLKIFSSLKSSPITGITLAINGSAMELSDEPIKEAKKRGITVSCDLNYCKDLWLQEGTCEIEKHVDAAITNEKNV